MSGCTETTGNEQCGVWRGSLGLGMEKGGWIPELSGQESWWNFVGWRKKRESRMTARPDLAKSHSKYPPRLTGLQGSQRWVGVIICTLQKAWGIGDQPGNTSSFCRVEQPRAPLWPGILGFSEQMTPLGCFEYTDKNQSFQENNTLTPHWNRK